MNFKTVSLILLAMVGSLVVDLPVKPAAADVTRAGALAAQIKTPAVRVALQCRVAFADTTASVPVKDRKDAQGAGKFWAGYLQRFLGIDVASCPDSFPAVFNKHLRTVSAVDNSLNHPQTRMEAANTKVSHDAGYKRNYIPAPAGANVQPKGQCAMLDDCGRTYGEVFAAANKYMKTAPPGDGQIAGQIDGLLKD